MASNTDGMSIADQIRKKYGKDLSRIVPNAQNQAQDSAGETEGEEPIWKQIATKYGIDYTPEEEEPDLGSQKFMDLPREAGKDVMRLGQLAGRGMQVVGLKKAGKWLEDDFKQHEDKLTEKQSPAFKKKMEQEMWTEASEDERIERHDDFGPIHDDGKPQYKAGPGWTSPTKIAGSIAGSAPTTVLGIATGGGFAALLIGRGIPAGIAGIIGAGISEGGISGAMTAKEVYDMVSEAPIEVLGETEEYKKALARTNDPDKARHIVARNASIKTGAVNAVVTGIAGAPAGAGYGRIIGGETGKTIPRTFLRQGGLEAAQEGVQSPAEVYLTNLEEKKYVNPELDPTSGMGEAIGEGIITGGTLGGAMGAKGHASNNKARRKADAAKRAADQAAGQVTDQAGDGPVDLDALIQPKGDLDANTELKVETDSTAMNAGGSTAQIQRAKQEEQKAKDTKTQQEQIVKTEQERSQLEHMQKEQAAQQQAKQQQEAQAQDYFNKHEQTENVSNQVFMEVLENPAAALDMAAKMINPLKNSGNPVHKQVVAPIEKAYRALRKGEDNLSRMQDISIDLDLLMDHVGNDKMQMLIEAVKSQVDQRVKELKAKKDFQRPAQVQQPVNQEEIKAAKAIERGDAVKQKDRAETVNLIDMDSRLSQDATNREQLKARLAKFQAEQDAKTDEGLKAKQAEAKAAKQQAAKAKKFEATKAKLAEQKQAQAAMATASLRAEQAKAATAKQEADEARTATIAESAPAPIRDAGRIENTLKRAKILNNETGSSNLINDLSAFIADKVMDGVNSFSKFKLMLQQRFKDAWDKIKPHAKVMWDVLNNERGKIEIGSSALDQFKSKWHDNGVKSAILDRDNTLNLLSLEVNKDDRGRGMGSKFMKELTALADKEGKKVELLASPLGSRPSKAEAARLKKFYEGYNFEVTNAEEDGTGYWMERSGPTLKADANAKLRTDPSEIPEFKTTQEAFAFGEKATPEQVTELTSRLEASRERSTKLKEKALSLADTEGQIPVLNKWMEEATKGQFLREALEAARGESPLQKKVNFQKTKDNLVGSIDSSVHYKGVKTAIQNLTKAAQQATKSVVVKTKSELPEHIQKKLGKGQAKAVYDADAQKTYFVADQIGNQEEVVKSWMHEQVGHHGLLGLFKEHGLDFNEFLDKAYDAVSKDPAWTEVANLYSEDLAKLDEQGKKRFIVEEVIAKRAEKLKPFKRKMLWSKIRNFVNGWLRSAGIDVKITNQDIDTLLETAKNRVMFGNERAWTEFKRTDAEYKEILKSVLKDNPQALSWYENHQKLTKDTFGDDADLFNILLGLTSPMARVDTNARWAVQTYLWMHGKAEKPGGRFPNAIAEKLEQIKKEGRYTSKSFKVDEFIRALLGDKTATVNDRWMYRVFFGESMLTQKAIDDALASEDFTKSLSDLDSKFLMPENTAARYKMLSLAKQLSEETGRKWTPVEIQAGLWMHENATSSDNDISEASDYQTALNKPIPDWDGLTPIEYLHKTMGDTPIGTLTKDAKLSPIAPVSRLEKATLKHMAAEGYGAVNETTKPSDLKHYIQQLHKSKHREVLTIPTLAELQASVKDGSRVFLTEDRLAGYILAPDGDIQKVFNQSGEPGLGNLLLVDAMANGGTKLDCYDGFLTQFYKKFGFQQYEVWPFNRDYVNEYWDDTKHEPRDVIALNLSEDVLKGFQHEKGTRRTSAIIDAIGSFEDSGSRGHEQKLDSVSIDSGNDTGSGSGLGKEASGATQGRSGILENDVKFSRSQLDPKHQEVHNKYIHSEESTISKIRGVVDSVFNNFKETKQYLKTKAATKAVDYLHPLAKQEEGKAIPAHLSGYIAKRLKSSMPTIYGAILNDGLPVYDKDGHWVGNDSSGGLLEVFHDLGNDADYFKMNWLADSAGELLKTRPDSVTSKMFGSDKDGNYYDPHVAIKELKEASKARYEANKEVWDKAAARLKEFNEAILKFSIEAGALSEESVDAFRREIYVPFNRVAETLAGDIFKMFPEGDKKFVSGIHHMKGSKLQMADPFESLLANYAYLMNQSLENVARKKIMYAYMGSDLIKKAKRVPHEITLKGQQIVSAFNKLIGEPGGRHPDIEPAMRNAYLDIVQMMVPVEKGNIISIRIKGKPEYYEVADADLFSAITDLQVDGIAKLVPDMLSRVKRIMTLGVTLRVPFRIKNFIRDAFSAAIIEEGMIPIWDSMKALPGAFMHHPDLMEMKAMGAAFIGGFAKSDAQKSIGESIKSGANTKGTNLAAKPFKLLYDLWERIGEASENAARLALYRNLKAKGVSKVEAGFRAKDLMDFSMKGGAPIVQGLIRVVPFLNARLQGNYKLGRAAVDPKSRKAFWTKGVAMAALTTALYAFNIKHNEEEWDALEDFDKWNNFHFWIGDTHLRVPVPFEVGVMFGTALPALLDSTRKNGSPIHKYLADTAIDTFAFNPIAIGQPIIDAGRNKDSFTGRPIEPPHLVNKNIDPGLRATHWNSKTLKELGKLTNLSPAKAQYLLKEYFGFMAEVPLAIADIGMHHIAEYPDDPAATAQDHWLWSVFVRDSIPRHTKWESEFYQLAKEVDSAWNTFESYRAAGERENAGKYRDKKYDKLVLKPKVSAVRDKLSVLNDKKKLIYMSRTLTPDQKRERLDDLQTKRNALFDMAMKELRD